MKKYLFVIILLLLFIISGCDNAKIIVTLEDNIITFGHSRLVPKDIVYVSENDEIEISDIYFFSNLMESIDQKENIIINCNCNETYRIKIQKYYFDICQEHISIYEIGRNDIKLIGSVEITKEENSLLLASFHDDYHKINIINEDNLLVNGLNKIYKTGEIVKFTVDNSSTFGTKVLLNNIELNGIGNEDIVLFEFAMPDEDILINISIRLYSDIEQPGYYVQLNELISWINEINIENIEEVKYEVFGTGIAPGSLSNISYSNEKNDILNIFNMLNSYVYKVDEIIAPGSLCEEYTIFTKENSYSLSIVQDLIKINNDYYKFVNNNEVLNNPNKTCHSLIAVDEFQLYNQSQLIGEYNGLGEFEFIKLEESNFDSLDYSISNDIIPIEYLIKFKYGILYIYDEKNFYLYNEMNNEVNGFYEITGNKNFSFAYEQNLYLENILFATGRYFELNTTIKDGINSVVLSIDDIISDSYQELFNTNLSNEYLIENYAVLYFIREEGMTSSLLDNVTYSKLFIENGKVYVTRTYDIDGPFVGDAAFSYYTDMILIPKEWTKYLNSPSNFDICVNINDLNGTVFNILSFEKLNDLKKHLRANGSDKYKELVLEKALGEYNDVLVIYPFNGISMIDIVSKETVAGFVFEYPVYTSIIVYKENKIYTLTEAYNEQLLTIDDIRIIHNLYY